ncbi:N-acetylglucosamine-6-phosphate deacetylase [Lederbergia wuyishanensis]|uniref:N-acetylglucosamine-6-phosphate deacetylase n=1 Tax=Lederbergia wuyishanensis TaxID=1347903 RepID=A0ABU0D398_9BACI|nr:N-acetylglucosamine-6-phosphate deacetylase [Lederbergia wuyishanensis]MCJ8007953.1 N-acetylglucosamine-6-phosphate deacetylase [Lederbergia wuyishanensis]MDQ0342878.1 N-acetylglucosamine-6-phosphate deacetylase [Lederbergia wuyishanensis]
METQVIINATIYPGGTESPIQNGFIRFAEKIIQIGQMDLYEKQAGEIVTDAAGKIVIPGMIDIHIHGGYGVDTMDADPEKMLFLSEKLLSEGVTSFFATTITQAHENISNALKAVKVAMDQGSSSIEGVHLEGPFINVKRAGAQPPEYIVDPDIELFLKWHGESGEQIKLVTYAPELPGGKEFEQVMVGRGIVPSVGHSDAVREELLNSAATHTTHLYNGMRGLHHREAGVAGHALLKEDIQVEIIADGIHITPDMIDLAYRIKGAEKISLISDAMMAKGMVPGEYDLGGQKVIVHDGEARLENGSLAGSVLRMDDAFRNIMKFTGCSISEAVQMTSSNQAREFGLKQKGLLAPEKDADIVIMDQDFEVEKTYRLGVGYEIGG